MSELDKLVALMGRQTKLLRRVIALEEAIETASPEVANALTDALEEAREELHEVFDLIEALLK